MGSARIIGTIVEEWLNNILIFHLISYFPLSCVIFFYFEQKQKIIKF